jgi:hypothetical protein
VLTFFCSKETEGSLKIYDISGKEIAVLASGKFNQGNHSFNWTPGDIASGVYFARLEIPEALKTQKIVYLR